ncbi:hypothetical protein [Methylobacterium dankookense]|uniref:hypothetical protein n=1 Tax=Methylobacterium dankookense TaxID=560405 RepID=UPI0011A9D2C0|nr:hypothetical protein [Methylobacterium dankookense]
MSEVKEPHPEYPLGEIGISVFYEIVGRLLAENRLTRHNVGTAEQIAILREARDRHVEEGRRPPAFLGREATRLLQELNLSAPSALSEMDADQTASSGGTSERTASKVLFWHMLRDASGLPYIEILWTERDQDAAAAEGWYLDTEIGAIQAGPESVFTRVGSARIRAMVEERATAGSDMHTRAHLFDLACAMNDWRRTYWLRLDAK